MMNFGNQAMGSSATLQGLCGNLSTTQTRWKFCPEDGQKFEDDWAFCPKCGKSRGSRTQYSNIFDYGRQSYMTQGDALAQQGCANPYSANNTGPHYK